MFHHGAIDKAGNEDLGDDVKLLDVYSTPGRVEQRNSVARNLPDFEMSLPSDHLWTHGQEAWTACQRRRDEHS
ncbi:hypothetical protein [Nonomuraea jabiensis]|uniref:Uncharacterized protein n=1 Tax=Nonomuraea jabiensis TaxID=882448 RepID=A0A7W9G5X1_9ACTN|nr:hypothetical protein [Nonomuraea jabiensis]MBB5777712.1 hypothetical protein [Nonomuraea jabiensis]